MCIVARIIAPQVIGAPSFSAASASFNHTSRSFTTWYWLRLLKALSMILSATSAPDPCPSSNLHAAIQMAISVGTFSRAKFSVFRAFSYVSSLASANHMSTLCGTHSTALESMILASLTSSNSIAVRHSFTELGMNSKALRSTTRFLVASVSSSAALNQIFTLPDKCRTALAKIVLAFSGGVNREASSQTSSFSGQISQPCFIIFLAATNFPAYSSNLAAAIQPGPCFGFVLVTLFSKSLAFSMSPTSALELIFIEFKLVKYPFGSTTVCPETLSLIRSKFKPKTFPRASAKPLILDIPPGVIFPGSSALTI
mmetsp:Transcript_7706/g.10818  ORF Transcript_7706/g.10818 Transcript_7706/m.10818 type:complete len:312 (-) Transcript_7706:280-1215(-)